MTPSYFNIKSTKQKSLTPPIDLNHQRNRPNLNDAQNQHSHNDPNPNHLLMMHYYNANKTVFNPHQNQNNNSNQNNNDNTDHIDPLNLMEHYTSTNSLTAKLLASSGFRRRSLDPQEGDNDINIILQPSDIDDIEKRARAGYARLKATTTTASLDDCPQQQQQQQSTNRGCNRNEKQTPALNSLPDHQSSKLKALTNIFEDIKLAKCLLDQDYNQTVRLFIKRSALNWNFNSFTFDALCCGRSLTELLLHLFDYYNLYQIFQLDIIKVLKCFRLLEFGYHSTNPYHNSVHAADVTQAMHCFIQEQKIRRHMTDLEILSSIMAAVCHDLDHPGVNQSFLVATKNPLAGLYQNNSVLENHHWRFALCIFKESKLFDHLEAPMLEDMKQQLKQLILATDIARQNDYLKRFKALTNSNKFSMSNTDDRALVLQMALKCADLGNPCRPWLISRVWSNLICDEFYRMGQIERRLGVPLTPICQREKTSIAGIQTDFFRFIVLPLLELWHSFLESPLSNLLMSNFDHNYQRWQRANRIVQQLRRRKSVACLEPIQDQENNGLAEQQQHYCYVSRLNSSPKSLARQNRSASLFHDPVIEDIYKRNSFESIKRASSDYIKSGNGGLESLRDFQLNRIIEKSPAMSRASRFMMNSRNRRGVAVDDNPKQLPDRARKVVNSGPGRPSSKRVAATQSHYQSPTNQQQQHQQPNPTSASSSAAAFRHQALSPIQDQDGQTSPEPAQQAANVHKHNLKQQQPLRDLSETVQQEAEIEYDDQESSTNSSSPRSRSQASSTSSSPVMKRSISSRTSIDIQRQQQHKASANLPFHQHDTTSSRFKLSKFSTNRLSLSVSWPVI